MGLKSRNKGKVGERAARDYLKSLGFSGETRRGQQYCGDGQADVVCPDLEHVWIEVKYGYLLSEFDLGRAKFNAAIEQASKDADGRPWVILWKPLRLSQWRMTLEYDNLIVTLADDAAIRSALCVLEDEGKVADDFISDGRLSR